MRSIDYIPLPATFGCDRPACLGGRPPCNDFGISEGAMAAIEIASIAASAAGAAVSYSAQQTAAKQSELNAKAQADAIHQEQVRQQQVAAENMRRQAAQDKRFRASQLANLSGQGFVPTSGTPLDLLADTAVQQQRKMQDMAYGRDITQRDLGYQASSTLQMGQAQASQQRAGAGATLLSGLASAAGSYAGYARVGSRNTTGAYQPYGDPNPY